MPNKLATFQYAVCSKLQENIKNDLSNKHNHYSRFTLYIYRIIVCTYGMWSTLHERVSSIRNRGVLQPEYHFWQNILSVRPLSTGHLEESCIEWFIKHVNVVPLGTKKLSRTQDKICRWKIHSKVNNNQCKSLLNILGLPSI